jgi:excisionase family DNA binding protein
MGELCSKDRFFMSETPRFYSKKEFAEILGVSLPSVDRRIADGTLKVVHFGKRCLVPATTIDELMCTVTPSVVPVEV